MAKQFGWKSVVLAAGAGLAVGAGSLSIPLNLAERREWERQASDWALYGEGRWAMLYDGPEEDPKISLYFRSFDINRAPLVALFSDYEPSPEAFIVYDGRSSKALTSVSGVPQGIDSLERILAAEGTLEREEAIDNLKLYVAPRVNEELNSNATAPNILPGYVTQDVVDRRIVLSEEEARKLGVSGIFESNLLQELVDRNRLSY